MRTLLQEFYASPEWMECSRAYLAKVDGLCEDCARTGTKVPAAIVHHLRPVTPDNVGDPNVTLNETNLRALCRLCHAKRHGAHQGQRYFVDRDGFILHLPEWF